MAKTFDDGILPFSLRADADLSAKQYYAVTAASTEGYAKTATGASNPAPIGVQQDDDASAVGDNFSIKPFGFTKAVCAACSVAGAACVIKYGTYLTTGSDGKFYASGGGNAVATARAFDALSTGCAILNVFFWGAVSGCAVAAS